MQLYFRSFLSSSLFFLEVVVNVFDYFWKPNSLFSKFCVNCLLMYYFVYCNLVIFVLWKMLMQPVNAPAHRWPCACMKYVSGLRRLEKFLNFLRCIHVFDLVLKYGSDINEGNWLQLLFYFIVLIGIVASVIGMSFFSAKFQVLDWSFFVMHFDGNVCNWIPGVIWPQMDQFWGFFVQKWLLLMTSYLYGLKSARIAQLLFVFDDIKFFRCLLWGVSWSVL